MAVASVQDRTFLTERGFEVVGNTFANLSLGLHITPVYVNPYDMGAAVIDGAPGAVIMWHAARVHTDTPEGAAPVVVGPPRDTPTLCYVQAELSNWGRR